MRATVAVICLVLAFSIAAVHGGRKTKGKAKNFLHACGWRVIPKLMIYKIVLQVELQNCKTAVEQNDPTSYTPTADIDEIKTFLEEIKDCLSETRNGFRAKIVENLLKDLEACRDEVSPKDCRNDIGGSCLQTDGLCTGLGGSVVDGSCETERPICCVFE